MLYALGNQRICVALFIASSLYYGSLESNQEYLRGMIARTCCGCSVAKSCARLCDPMECSAPGSSILHYVMEMFIESVLLFVATCSGKQTPSEEQCREWSAVYYTGGPKAESPLSQGPRPAFVKIFYTPYVRVWTHHSKFLETYINQGKYNPNTPIIHVLCTHVLKQSNH